MIDIRLKAGKEASVKRLHPWVFSGAIHQIPDNLADGDLVRVLDRSGTVLGIGHFHHGSIAVRLLHFGEADLLNTHFWENKLSDAWQTRQAIGLTNNPETACFRLIHGEGDGLSGLVVDLYGQTAVLQCHSIGMHRQRQLIARTLLDTFPGKIQFVYDKSAEALPKQYAAQQQNAYLGEVLPSGQGASIVVENGVHFKVDWETGQKTGFFLDQRDNRALLSELAPGKSVLNTFCYTGGFSAYALKHGASLVHSVDVSAKAMELCAENAVLNAPDPSLHTGFTEDALVFLKQGEHLYDIVVVDPPAYAKSLDKRHNAVQGYKRLNMEALRRVKPGGLMFTFSCSQVVDRALFYHTIAAAAIEVGRPARVLRHLSQGADHPVSLFHPEGAYLKGLLLRVG